MTRVRRRVLQSFVTKLHGALRWILILVIKQNLPLLKRNARLTKFLFDRSGPPLAVRDGMARLTVSEFDDVVLKAPEIALLCLNPKGSRLTVANTLRLTMSPSLVSASVTSIAAEQRDPSQRSVELWENVCLSPNELPRDGYVAALIAISRVAASLRSDDAGALLEHCLQRAVIPQSPYVFSPIQVAAVQAARSIVASHPQLDELVAKLASEDQSGVARSAAAIGFATATKNNSARANRLFAYSEYTAKEIQTFCAALARHGTAAAVEGRPDTLARTLGVRAILARAVPAIPLALITAAIFGPGLDQVTPNSAIGLSETLAVAGVLITAQLVSAQIAAGRLPGSIGRHSSFSLPVRAGYATLLGLLLITYLLDQRWFEDSRQHLLRGQLLGFTCLTALVAGSLVSLVRSTDSVIAVHRFSQSQQLLVSWAGLRFGWLQRRMLAVRNFVLDSRFVSHDSFRASQRSRIVIHSERQGFHTLSKRHLQRLGRRPPWSTGELKLEVVGGLGNIVPEGHEVAGIVPNAHRWPDQLQVAQARTVFRSRSSAAVEAVEESASSMIEVLVAEAGRGNRGRTLRVARDLRDHIGHHLLWIERGRGARPGADAAVAPALQSSIQSLVRCFGDATNERQRALLVEAIATVSQLRQFTNRVSILLAGALQNLTDEADRADHTAQLYALALEISFDDGPQDSSTLVLSMTASRVNDATTTASTWLRVTSALVASFQWRDPFHASQLWRWYRDSILDSEAPSVLGASLIGAAAYASGYTATAFEVAARTIPAWSSSGVGDYLNKDEVVRAQSGISKLYGSYLGSQPERVLIEFLEFRGHVEHAYGRDNS